MKKLIFTFALFLGTIVFLLPQKGYAPNLKCKYELTFKSRDLEVIFWMQQYMVTDAVMWMKVARIESGFRCNSHISLKQNNVFGMHHARSRKTTSVGSFRGHAKYNTLHDAVVDLTHRLKRVPRKKGESFYVYLRRTGYNINPDSYEQTLRRVRVNDLIATLNS